MSTLSEIITASYTTSRDADGKGKALKSALGCESNYEIARLALGRSLALDSVAAPAPDAKGTPMKGSQLFGTEAEASYLWIALLGEQLRLLDHPQLTLEGLQQLVRDHWHRGVEILSQEWQEAGENEAEFITLLARRGDLPENGSGSMPDPDPDPIDPPPTEKADAVMQASLRKQLETVGVAVEFVDSLQGPRLTRFKLYLSQAGHYALLEKSLEQLAFALGCGENSLSLMQAPEAQTCWLDLPREADTWRVAGMAEFRQALRGSEHSKMTLPVTTGVDVAGSPVLFDLAEAPHLLIGGTTGSGKSVCLNALLLSLYLRSRTLPIQLALVDPKRVELRVWAKSGMLYGDIATTVSEATHLLNSLIEEMEARYARFEALGVKSLAEARQRGEQTGWIVLAVDELADLVVQGKPGKAAQEKLERLAQKSRAAGIHLILATQRPEAATFSGLLRSNCPSRIALHVQKSTESGIILGEVGAEKLLGKGDMLVKTVGDKLKRVHGFSLNTEEIQACFTS